MIAPPRPKLWTALLLLICSLTSAPLGSMEQAGTAVLGCGAHGQSVPVARAGTDVEVVLPSAQQPRTHHLDGAASSLAARPFDLASQFLTPLPSTAPPHDFVPGIIARLPYHATPPPPVRLPAA